MFMFFFSFSYYEVLNIVDFLMNRLLHSMLISIITCNVIRTTL